MSERRDDEPVFVRSKWGTNRYVYNPNNPVGLVLILGSLIFAAGIMYYLQASTPRPNLSWSEGELRSAVHQAAASLEKEPQFVDEYLGYSETIKEAVEQTGKGPSFGVEADKGSARDAPDDYTVTGDGTDAEFCMHVLAGPVDKGYANLSIKVTDGSCPDT